MIARRRFAALAAALVVALGACGGSSTADFKKDYKAIDADLGAVGNDLGKAIQGAKNTTDVKLATQFAGLADRSTKVIKRLDALKPPSKVKSDVKNLSAALSKVSGDMRDIAAGLREPVATDAQHARITQATIRLLQDSTTVKSAAQAVRTKEGIKRAA
jgi:hypothetical protein